MLERIVEPVVKSMRRALKRWKYAEYMTDGWVIWKYDRKYAGEPRPKKGEGIKIGTCEWVEWCLNNDKLIFYDSRIGKSLIKTSVFQKKYIYWIAYKWPMCGKPPVKVHIGRLEVVTTRQLRLKMRRLVQRCEEKKARLKADKERRSKQRERLRKRRWKRRMKTRRLFGCSQ